MDSKAIPKCYPLIFLGQWNKQRKKKLKNTFLLGTHWTGFGVSPALVFWLGLKVTTGTHKQRTWKSSLYIYPTRLGKQQGIQLIMFQQTLSPSAQKIDNTKVLETSRLLNHASIRVMSGGIFRLSSLHATALPTLYTRCS